MSFGLRLLGIIIMGISAYVIFDVLIAKNAWYYQLRTFGIMGFCLGLLLLVEGIALEIRETSRESGNETGTKRSR